MAGIDRLREEHGIDPASARAAHDVGNDPETKLAIIFDGSEQIDIDLVHAAVGPLARMEIAARPGKVPQLARNAVHVDRQAYPAIADERDP